MRDLSLIKNRKSPVLKIITLTTVFLAAIIGIIYYLNIEKYVFKGPKTVVQLITDSGLKKDRGRTNVLLLGIGGRSHDGPNLTDTIILASIDQDKNDVVLVSIPRDLWVPEESTKINHLYAYGQEVGEQGLESATNIVEELLGIPIHYAFRIDFNGFITAVNLVDGLEINVDTSFVDPKYPITGKETDLCNLTIETQEKDGQQIQIVKDATGSAIPLSEINDKNDPFLCRYETLTFQKGITEMDGAAALKFVRSRHGTNGEGSDFARSTRQQKVLLAFREKILSQKTLMDPKKIIQLAATLDDSIDTNIGDEEIPLFIKLTPKISGEYIRHVVLDATRQESLLEFGLPQNYAGQSVLIPKNNDWESLRNYLVGEIYKESSTSNKENDTASKNN